MPFDVPETRLPSFRSVKKVLKAELSSPSRLRRWSSMRQPSRSPRHGRISAPSPSHSSPTKLYAPYDSATVEFASTEFLTLDEEPWIAVDMSTPHPDFGLPMFSLAQNSSNISLNSVYSTESASGDDVPGYNHPGTHSFLASEPISHANSLANSESSSSYLPDFRRSVIMLNSAPPPRPPRRRPAPRSPTSVYPFVPAAKIPLLHRRLGSYSSITSGGLSSHASREGSLNGFGPS
ncbi:hypothetical protein SISNIDRAFT_461009 [Sistotremastrum niveocremeum HHB9708]|uniref:Uncharacterized protein n=1 Tax=Sistotremastrum niveocremeum HHB9708 TaxID=1314777 RepID=A0A164N2J2_9AGAM|nr:hypothetical protein SISNIDRAFT_461009 [Sistotremastrum niveocremeum HHB9708]